MDILFNINPLGLEGLCSTLTSLIGHCSKPEELGLWFLCSELNKDDKTSIEDLLISQRFDGTAEYIDFDAKKIFGHLRSLHGDWTPYGRLLIAKYIKSDSALYLDADLIISTDVLSLKDYKFDGNILAAVYGSTVYYALERNFFMTKLNLPPDVGYFNSGVILFNLKMWREFNIESKWVDLAEKHPNDLLSVDQTLLNALCQGKFARLPSTFNTPWYPGERQPENAENAILHFVGSPKPWDIMGKVIHDGYSTWNAYNTLSWRNKYGKLSFDKLKRTWKIRKSIFRHLIQKIKR